MIKMTSEFNITLVNKTPMTLSKNKENDVIVEGIAVSNDINVRSLIITRDAMTSAVQRFKKDVRKPKVLIDHEYDTTNVVGRVLNLNVADDGLRFKISLNPDHPSGIYKAIERGDVDAVSIGALVSSIKCSICGGEILECDHELGLKYDNKMAIGLVGDMHLKELSITAFPADENALIKDVIAVVQSINASKKSIASVESPIKKVTEIDPKYISITSTGTDSNFDISTIPVFKGTTSDGDTVILKYDENTNTYKISEKFINNKKVSESDIIMTNENSTEKNEVISQEKPQENLILQSALEKLATENKELERRLKEQEAFINQIKRKDREEKVNKLLQLTTLKREEIESYSDEALDASIKMLEKVVAKKDVKSEERKLNRSLAIQPEYTGDVDDIKKQIRSLFGFPEPSEKAKETAKVISVLRKKGYML